jgi:hypothetical protein
MRVKRLFLTLSKERVFVQKEPQIWICFKFNHVFFVVLAALFETRDLILDLAKAFLSFLDMQINLSVQDLVFLFCFQDGFVQTIIHPVDPFLKIKLDPSNHLLEAG